MKIAVEGKIIDTDNIYLINEVVEDHNTFVFTIESFNDIFLEISVAKYDKNSKSAEWDNLRSITTVLKETKEQTDYMIKLISVDVPEENKARLEKMRQDIYNIWSSNQSELPSFDIKKY